MYRKRNGDTALHSVFLNIAVCGKDGAGGLFAPLRGSRQCLQTATWPVALGNKGK